MAEPRSDLIHFAIDPEGVWHHSKFPDPFITADYDERDRLIALSFVGPAAHQLDGPIRQLVAEALR